jgi:hypothetical protein
MVFKTYWTKIGNEISRKKRKCFITTILFYVNVLRDKGKISSITIVSLSGPIKSYN